MKREIRKYYKYHYREQLDFRYRLYLLGKEKDLSKRVDIARNLMFRLSTCGMGIYSCPELEKPFIELAKTVPPVKTQPYRQNSFLHIMTQSYQVGGHTRVTERWIETSPIAQKHSIVLLEQQDESIPSKLEIITKNHNGDLYVFKEKTLINKARMLRELSMQYEYIILHIHMCDPTVIVAFGTEDFTRPVILFNHADYTYWCGASIVDLLADLRDNEFAKKRRGIDNVYPLRIPFEPNKDIQRYSKTREQSRADLGLPLDKKIILTVGGAHKYRPFAGCEFCDFLSVALNSYEDVMCFGIGPTSDIGGWSKYGNKFTALGEIQYGKEYFDYLNACDVYVNSMPIGGGTAMLDAIQFRKPVISFSLFDDHLGEIIQGIDTYHDSKQFIHELKKILSSNSYANNLATKQFYEVLKYHGEKNWRNNLINMLNITPKKHCVKIHNNRLESVIDDLSIMVSLWNNSISHKKLDFHDIYHIIRRVLKF